MVILFIRGVIKLRTSSMDWPLTFVAVAFVDYLRYAFFATGNAIMLFRAAGLLKVISAVQPSGLFAHGPAKKQTSELHLV